MNRGDVTDPVTAGAGHGSKEAAPRNIDEYIAGFPAPVRERLEQVRATIRAAAPGADEKISYRMPSFAQRGMLVWFAAHRRHIGLYPTASGIEHFKHDLEGFSFSKGAVQFPFDQPLPLDLIHRIVTFRVAENRGKAELKGKR